MNHLYADNKWGFGDRLYKLLLSILYCEYSGRQLILNGKNDLFYTNESDTDSFKLYFDISYPHKETSNNIIRVVPLDTKLVDPTNRIFRPDFFKNEEAKLINKLLLESYFKCAIHIDNIDIYNSIVFNKYISIRSNIVDEALLFCKSNNINNLIGIHLRQNTPDSNKTKIITIKKTIKLINNTIDYIINNKIETVYLATDNMVTRDFFKEKLESKDINLKYVRYLRKIGYDFRSQTNELLNINRIDPNCDLELFGKEALIEVIILSQCKEIISSSLGYYSWLAKMIKVNNEIHN